MDSNPSSQQSEPKTDREIYEANLEAKIRKAGKARRFTESEDGSVVKDFLVSQINGLIKTLGGTKYLNDNNLANYDRGQLAMAQKLLQMLDNEANTDAGKLQEQLKASKTDV